MSISQIHDELEALAGGSPAAYIETDTFARLTSQRLLETINLLTGKTMPAGNGQLSACLISSNGANALKLTLAPPVAAGGRADELDILLTPRFDAVVSIFLTNDPAKVISTLTISFRSIRIHLYARSNSLVLEGVDFDVRRKISRTKEADTYLKDAGIDPLEAARIEGHLAYGVVTQAAAAALAKRTEWPLASLFPAVDFGTTLRLAILAKGEAIGIIPTSAVTINQLARCICTEHGEIQHSTTTITNNSPPNPQPNDELGQVNLGGPIPDGKDPLQDFGRRFVGGGSAGIYIPKSFASALTVNSMPAVKIKASDTGWIGFSAEANVGFRNFRTSFDLAAGGILVDIDLDISVSAYCDMDISKGVRLPIGWAIVMPANGSSPANLQLGFYPAVDANGTVRLKSTLRRADMGSYVAVVIGIGTALKLLGITAWIGFLIDVVLATILSNGLPLALKKAIGESMSSGEWKLLDGQLVFDPIQRQILSAPFQVKADSLLASVRLDV